MCKDSYRLELAVKSRFACALHMDGAGRGSGGHMSELPKRKIIRLKDYDYRQNGAYSITMCIKDKHAVFGAVVGTTALGRPSLSALGHPQNESGRPFVELTPLGKMCRG